MPRVKVVRSSEYMNRLRDYTILINGKEVGAVSNGETTEFEVPSGEHHLYGKIDWCFSPAPSWGETI